MPISTKHPAYVGHESQWQRCRDVADGSDAVKERGEKYLPKLTQQSSEEYDAYRLRAYWFGGTARIIQGLTGAVMSKDPVTEDIPAVCEPILKDVTQQGSPFAAFVKSALNEVLKTGRYGVLVDMPVGQMVSPRPYWVGYDAEQVVNWQTEMRDGVPTLTFVSLCEWVSEEDPKDPYIILNVEQYRELYLDPGENGGYVYRQQVWRKERDEANGVDNWATFGPPITPVMRQTPLNFIPFCFMGPSTITPAIEKPPVLDLVDANLSHYRSSADLEHGRHFTALPTPWVAGFPETTELPIGSGKAWVSNDVQAHAGMLEFTGQGLGALETAIKDKKEDMAVLGARLLEPQKPSVEASETLKTRLAGEFSVLQSVALTLGVGFSKILEWSSFWLGAGEASKKATAKLNTELLDSKMTFDELTKLVMGWQSGAMSFETMYFNMERGGLTRPGITSEKEQAQIEIEKPAVIPQNIDPETGLPDPMMNPDGTPKTGAKEPAKDVT